MSWYRTRMYVCDICKRKQEAAALFDGALTEPAGWFHQGRRWGMTLCRDCRDTISRGSTIWLQNIDKAKEAGK